MTAPLICASRTAKAPRKLIIASALFALTTPAIAVDLTVDQTAMVFMPDGVTVKKICVESDAAGAKYAKSEDMTIGIAIQTVLVPIIPNDPENGKADSLAIRLYGQDRPSIKHEDQILILKRADKISDPVTIARLRAALEPEPVANHLLYHQHAGMFATLRYA